MTIVHVFWSICNKALLCAKPKIKSHSLQLYNSYLVLPSHDIPIHSLNPDLPSSTQYCFLSINSPHRQISILQTLHAVQHNSSILSYFQEAASLWNSFPVLDSRSSMCKGAPRADWGNKLLTKAGCDLKLIQQITATLAGTLLTLNDFTLADILLTYTNQSSFCPWWILLFPQETSYLKFVFLVGFTGSITRKGYLAPTPSWVEHPNFSINFFTNIKHIYYTCKLSTSFTSLCKYYSCQWLKKVTIIFHLLLYFFCPKHDKYN